MTLGRELGEIVNDTLVRVVVGKRTYLAQPDPIPFHTDHPKADIIAWRCESQDGIDGASRLIDGYHVLQQLAAAERAILKTLELPAMVRLGDPATPTPILAGESSNPRVFYAPWLEPISRPPDSHKALLAFRLALDREEGSARSIRLRPGQVLLVDNHRVLHGRRSLLPNSTRKLRRLWIQLPAES